MPSEVVPDLLPRIAAARRALEDALEAADLRRRQRDDLIVRAVDAGVSQRQIAAAAGVKQPRIIAILMVYDQPGGPYGGEQ
jgi:hypothetical protein